MEEWECVLGEGGLPWVLPCWARGADEVVFWLWEVFLRELWRGGGAELPS